MDAFTNLVIIGNGMVGHHFIEELVDKHPSDSFNITILCEEPRVAYDRVHLSSYFSHHTSEELSLVKEGFYEKHNINVLIGERAITINRQEKIIHSNCGRAINYDKLVLATGSFPWVPPIKGNQSKDCFVYRTIEDLNAIENAAKRSKRGVVVGGGLLGLEAAGALKALGVDTHVIEFAPVLMAEQLDFQGGELLKRKIESMGVTVHNAKNTKEIVVQQDEEFRNVLQFADGSELETDFIVFSTGIRPQDKLAKQCGLATGRRGGVAVNNHCVTSDIDVYAIGECASWNEQYYGLVAPGYNMAKVAASHLNNGDKQFEGADMSAKLKLLGVEVGSIGDAHGKTEGSRSYVYLNEKEGIYKRIVVDGEGKELIGAVLVGDTSSYSTLLQYELNHMPLPENPDSLILPGNGTSDSGPSIDALPDSAVICSCLDVKKSDILQAVNDGASNADDIKTVTGAGTGCGGCLGLISQVVNGELAAQGIQVKSHLCDHFEYTRQELYHLIRVEKIKTFDELLKKHGTQFHDASKEHQHGCEVCKPAVGSILASCWNGYVLDSEQVALQDTNDNFLGNMQKNGTYSVIPRMPAGEVTPVALGVLAAVAEQYNLYTKVTGAQRIGLFGAHKQDLPDIWRKLLDAGFETGHAYAKSLRMVKTCVGSTWCRFGVGDSVGFGSEIENRYKGIRSPHKLKFGVSGCTRECAEAQGKDIGIIATTNGWNLYVGGNGGMKPAHGQLLAGDIDQKTVIKYIDRILMFYVRTADKLQRTSNWLNNLDGGIDYLKEVIINNKLGINQELENEIQILIDSYQCEWQTTLDTKKALKRFDHFINSDQSDPLIQFDNVRGQISPTPFEKIEVVSLDEQNKTEEPA